MKILHYSLGFPPYRTGGLTKYCTDLMIKQIEQGDNVTLLWPGEIKLINHSVFIKKRREYLGISSYEIINPLPIALDEGIKDIYKYTKECDVKVYLKFLSDLNPQVIHIHTLMGIHREFFEAAKKLDIKIIYTTHDYYGICPKVTLFREMQICKNDFDCKECVECNKNALSLKKIMIMQSQIYRYFKNSKIIKFLRKRHRDNYFEGNKSDRQILSESYIKEKSIEYKMLRHYYLDILLNIEAIHFNSTLSQETYKKYFMPKREYVISLTHNNIINYSKQKVFDNEVIRITYLASTKPFKGFNFLINSLDILWSEKVKNFSLSIYSDTKIEREYLRKNKPYNYEELEDIFKETDLLVVPSIWLETFGFTALEALSYKVPVVVSENVGAKDILPHSELVFDINSLKEVLRRLIQDKNKLKEISENIKSVKESSQHIEEIKNMYLEVINERNNTSRYV